MVQRLYAPAMGREQFKTPDEDIAAEFDRVCQLFQLAMGRPSDRVLFESLMGEANDKGLNWIQGLEYVIEHRSEITAPVEFPGKRPALEENSGVNTNDLRRAG